ncbi:beta-N-acetylhexosaminidase [Gelidibacter salicanalis]|uniref:beta-N-acetylhexosaminidase n=1 Tax=Gelidibacter salicanalis TaxID=291193 RepID=A0A934KWG1_9FLAO|nr:beta-N-acetylhexosaminidase [Gelidibacter salicanalis]MBJ7882123.1 beta-N-acetylhexosaminidase [Gelidibacter salicanalis]
MKFILFTLIGLFTLTNCAVKTKSFTASEIAVLPQPNSLKLNEGSFKITADQTMSTNHDAQKTAAEDLQKYLAETSGQNITSSDSNDASITFEQNESLGPEAYELTVTPKKIRILANDAAGYFYGVQTLKQLVAIETGEGTKNTSYLIPSVTIQDSPRFKWRAYMIDDSRYFHGEEHAKRMIDQMALLKMNTLHWHLIDDAGWRVEIKKYPLLTEVGAFRADTEIETWKSGKTSGEPHGGFYTQEQIKDIVAYAKARNINVVPEFEMPGHSSAAIAAYTWLGTAGVDIDVPVTFGRLYDNYDVTKPEVITFIKDVLTELFELFPSEVIHIGGDEVGYEVWEKSASVQKYMKEHNINTPADLQIDFTNKISQYIGDNGRRMMGWNEILGKNIHTDFAEKKGDQEAETELAKNVIVHFWKGDLELLSDAAKNGYAIVNSLHSSTYLDYGYTSIPLKKAYDFDPIPEGLDVQYHKNIYGTGAQMWSEWTPTHADVERQTFPRIAAYAEVGWTELENKDYDSFKVALKKMQQHWDSVGINYFKDSDKLEAEEKAKAEKK